VSRAGAATVVPVHSGVAFLLNIDIQSADGRVCEAVALLQHSAGMNLSK